MMHRLYYWMWKSIGDKKFCRHCCLFCKFYEVCRQDGDCSQKDKGREWGLFAFILLLPFSPNSVIVEIVNFSVLTD